MDDTGRDLIKDPDLFRKSFEDSTEAIVFTDLQGRIFAVNQAWLNLYGYARDEVIGQTTRLIKSPHTTSDVYRYMWERIQDPSVGSWKGEIVNAAKNGEEIPVLLTISPVRHDGGIVAYMGIGLDQRERKQIEEMKELYDLVMRHDLKAPLGGILALLHVMLDGMTGELSDRQRDILQRAVRSGERMKEIIATSLDLEKLRRGTLRLDLAEVDLFAVVRETFETLADPAARAQVSLELRAGPRPAVASDRLTLRLDPVHLQRAVDNLVKNAIEAAPSESPVLVEVSGADGKGAIRVINGGKPIPPPVRATLFHPFSTYGKKGGTGLGIYGVKMAVEAMGGAIRYETGEEGTMFEIAFSSPPSASESSESA